MNSLKKRNQEITACKNCSQPVSCYFSQIKSSRYIKCVCGLSILKSALLIAIKIHQSGARELAQQLRPNPSSTSGSFCGIWCLGPVQARACMCAHPHMHMHVVKIYLFFKHCRNGIFIVTEIKTLISHDARRISVLLYGKVYFRSCVHFLCNWIVAILRSWVWGEG